jgi:hypothetical protein
MSRSDPAPRAGAAPAAARLALGLGLALAACGEQPRRGPRLPLGEAGQGDVPAALAPCNRCHLVPDSGILPRERWRHVVQRMGEVTVEYALDNQLTQAEIDAAVAWLAERAPEVVRDADPRLEPSPLAFRRAPLGLGPVQGPQGPVPPLVGNVLATDLDGDGRRDVLVSDIGLDALTWIHRAPDGGWSEATLCDVRAPAGVDVADLDGDGDLDLALASLGSVEPSEERIGSVVLQLRDGEDGGVPRFEEQTVLTGVARVSDVSAADLDGDGDLDLAVAMFGLYKTGGALWLERRPEGRYKRHVIVQRNGVSHAPAADFDGDGRIDVLVLISQEHEELVLYVGRGRGRFEPYPLFQGPHPMFGLSGCEPCDLDGDGDLDVLFANGDALDQDPHPKPWHGAHWLENRTEPGARPAFVHHELVRFPGAYCASPGDLDGDGDLDVVVSSMVNRWDQPDRQSLIWLENTGTAGFVAHPLDTAPAFLVTAEVADLDGDGRADVVAGGMHVLPPHHALGRVTAWFQTGRAGPR